MGVWALKLAKLLLPKLAPYVVAILATLTFVGVAYMKGKSAAEETARVEQLEAENKSLRTIIEDQRNAIQADNKVAEENEKRIVELEAKTKELLSSVENADALCLDGPDTERLRDVWKEWNGAK